MEEKYKEFLKENFNKEGCSNCGSKKLITSEDIYAMSQVTYPQGSVPTNNINNFLEVLVVVCSNCGYIHSFTKKIIDKEIDG